MADFQPILARAIAALPDKSAASRRSVYDRASAALLAQLRGLDPPLGEAEIMRERLALDEAVARIEAGFGPEDPPSAPAAGETAGPAPAYPTPPETMRPGEPRFSGSGPEEPPERDLDAYGDPLPDPVETEPQVIRPRVGPPRERRVKPGHVRTAIVGGGVAVAVAAIAGAAFYVNKVAPSDTGTRTRVEAPVRPAQPDNAGKLNDRVGEAGASAPGAAPRPGAGTPTTTASGEVVVAQRAILYTETPENPQAPLAQTGRVFWRLDSESAGQGRPVETIVRATVEIAEAGFGLDFTIRRNADPAFPASHIMGLRFTRTGDGVDQAVREVGVPQMKVAEGERGAPLSAISSALGENLFVAALSNVPVEVERNIDLLQNRSWIDIPVRFASGKRGILTFEKGVSGAQTLADALGRWQ